MGFASASAFHDWLSNQADLGCNYSYYSRIEGGEVLPSPSVLAAIADLLPDAQGDGLTLLYCQAVFPTRRKLFKARSDWRPAPAVETSSQTEQKEKRVLTRRQVDQLVQSKLHYLLFLMATLARRPLSLKEVEARLDIVQVHAAFARLKEVKILRGEAEGFSAAFPDMKFPKADSPELKKVYSQMDAWDRQIAEELSFTSLTERFLFIRVSSRYLGLIQSHCDLLLGLIRSAEETEPAHNEEVISFSIKLHTGRLPG